MEFNTCNDLKASIRRPQHQLSQLRSEGRISTPCQDLFRYFGDLSFAWTAERDLRVSSSSLSYLVYLSFPTWCQGRCRETLSIYSSCTRYVATGPTVLCCAKRLLPSPFITHLFLLLTPCAVVCDDTFAISTWLLSSPFDTI